MKKSILVFFYFLYISSYIYAQCPSCHTAGYNLITNPGFEAGNIGFTSDYTYGPNGSGYYTIDTNASNFFGGFFGKDHTSGSGKFMIIDGAGKANKNVWSQTIDSIIPNQSYYFAAWVCNLYNPPYAILQFSINGVGIGKNFSSISNQGKWILYYVIWNSGNDTTATISLVNNNTNANGNDFGLDDLSFSTCIPNPVFGLNFGPDAPLCLGKNRILDAGANMDSYIWNDGDTSQTKTISDTGTYWVTIKKNGCTKSDTIRINSILPSPSFILGNDTNLCNDSIRLNITNHSWPITWFYNQTIIPDTNHHLLIYKSGYYKATIGIDGCNATDSIYINQIILPDYYLGNDTSYCEGDTALFTFKTDSTIRFLWNDGDTLSTKKITQSGIYTLKTYNQLCQNTDTVILTFISPPSINLGNDTSFCIGNNYILDATTANTKYSWYFNNIKTIDTSASIAANLSGKYMVIVDAAPCLTKDSINLTINPGPIISLNDTFTLCEDFADTVFLYPGKAVLYNWHPINSTDSIIYINKGNITLTLSMTDTFGCVTSKDIRIEESCPPRIYIPDAFSPNYNNTNDLFLVKGMFVSSYYIYIYNRWGTLMYESNDLAKGWDGTYNNKPCLSGLYIYVIDYTGTYKNQPMGNNIGGYLMLMR